jgi:L-lactate dehydrogenase complex protein LldE
MADPKRRAQLFPTCLIDEFYPEVGEAVVEILERSGYRVEVPLDAICCGQPAFNSGFHDEARRVIRHTLGILSQAEGSIVIPSGSCTAMMVHQAPDLFREEPETRRMAKEVAARCHELSQFLVEIALLDLSGCRFSARVAYHPSCHLSRGLGVRSQPLSLLEGIKGLSLVPFPDFEECCGFGGIFSVKMPEISSAMMRKKIDAIAQASPDILVSCDMGCLTHIGGGLHRKGSSIEVHHLAQVIRRSFR